MSVNHSALTYHGKKYSSAVLIFSVIAGSVMFCSCESKVDIIKNADVLSLPSVTGRNIETTFSDSGKIQLLLRTPVIETFNNSEEPYSIFREGLNILFYDGHDSPIASASGKYAKYIEKKKLWELKDSVVLINQDGDKLETEQLFWDEDKDLIYTDRFVKITREDQTIMGTGFESDSRMLGPKIKKVTATLYLKDE